jgi:hypothetical protein
MEYIKNFLLNSIEQNTIIWIFISSLLGGIIGASLKIIFEFLIPYRFKENKDIKENFRVYCHHLLLASREIDRRLDFIITDKAFGKAFESEDSKLSLFYSFGQFLGWCKIIQHNALEKIHKKPKSFRKFFIMFFDTYKALSSQLFFKGFTTYEQLYETGAIIPVHAINSIGFCMLSNIVENNTIVKLPIINYNDFLAIYNSDKRFKVKFQSFDKLITNIYEDYDCLAWNRIILFSISLKILIHNIDRDKLENRFNNNNYIDKLNPEVSKQLIIYLKSLKKKKGFKIPPQFKIN